MSTGVLTDALQGGIVRSWDADEGWGVIDAAEVPGGSWTHYSSIEMIGYKELRAGQPVEFVAEDFLQDGFTYRTVWVRPLSNDSESA